MRKHENSDAVIGLVIAPPNLMYKGTFNKQGLECTDSCNVAAHHGPLSSNFAFN